jgi:hypothetical protein
MYSETYFKEDDILNAQVDKQRVEKETAKLLNRRSS